MDLFGTPAGDRGLAGTSTTAEVGDDCPNYNAVAFCGMVYEMPSDCNRYRGIALMTHQSSRML